MRETETMQAPAPICPSEGVQRQFAIARDAFAALEESPAFTNLTES
jgi:hypothetical protein